jgi:prepilin-type N-terminal cleavage/methylation domain-containing protein
MRKGFSLIELSLVVVIIGLILAGIASGSALLKQTEIKTVIAEIQQYRTAFQEFSKRYKQYPGDMINTSDYWDSSDCFISGDCDGNGNGIVDIVWNSNTDEAGRAWIHLTLADLVDHKTNPLPATYNGSLEIGVLAPASQIDSAGYFIAGSDDIGGDTAPVNFVSPWSTEFTNAVFLGRKGTSGTSSGLVYGALSGKSAFSIDEKIDDATYNATGNPIGHDTGKIRTTNSIDGGSNCIASGAYVISSTSESCILGYQLHDR